MRINKLMSNAGICSRREANVLINQGRVIVNGEICTPGKWVEWSDDILFDNKKIEMIKMVYILFNKPIGITCTMNKSVEGNIVDALNYDGYVFPVGRLDKESEGLILFTNDGDLADRVLRDEYEHEKEYIVTLDKEYDDIFIETLESGVEIFGIQTKPCKIKKISKDTFSIILLQGLNRQIRKMCKKYKYNVIKLKRVRIVNLKIDNLEIGKWRYVDDNELMLLKDIVNQ